MYTGIQPVTCTGLMNRQGSPGGGTERTAMDTSELDRTQQQQQQAGSAVAATSRDLLTVKARYKAKTEAPECFPEGTGGGPAALLKSFVYKAIEAIPYAGENLVWVAERIDETMDLMEKSESQNQCMAVRKLELWFQGGVRSAHFPNSPFSSLPVIQNFISKTINKAISAVVRKAFGAHLKEYRTFSDDFKVIVKAENFSITKREKREQAVRKQ